MSKVGALFLLLFACMDVCVLSVLRSLQLSPQNSLFFPCPPLVALWGGELTRAVFLLLLLLLCANGLSGARVFGAVQSILVLCLHLPTYVTLLHALGWAAEEEMWGWHSWERMFQGYLVMMVSWIYWTQYVQSLLVSLSLSVSSVWRPRSSKQEPKKKATSPLRRLMSFMRPHFGCFLAVMLLVGLSSFCEMAVPMYTGQVTEWIQNKGTPDAFTEAITIIAIMTAVSAVMEFIGDLMYIVTMSNVHSTVQGDVFQAVLKQEIAFFDRTPTGDLVSRITTDTNIMSEALSERLSLLMWYTFRMLFVFFFMVKQSWKLSLLTSMGLPVIWVLPKFTAHLRERISVKIQDALAKANQVATETFSCIKTVKSFANEDGETKRYERCMEDLYALNKIEAAAYAGTTSANSMTTLIMKVSILYYGSMLVTRGTVSSGELVSFILYELQFASALDALMHSYPEVKKAVGGSEKIFEYLERKPQIPPEGTLAPKSLKGYVQFQNVKFAYSSDIDNVILKGVTLEMKPGQITALVGLNRSGKSTCVKLLERFYQPQGGQILLDGEPLDSYKDAYLRQKISVVSQDCALFARSVRENIKYGCPDVSDEDMYRAARLASAHNFIMGLSKGYDTDAGEKGGQLSGGQKQRIAIARALIRQPTILVLDNATSDLDSENEQQVYQALLSERVNNCSVLLISTKMSVVERADHIIVLHDGVVEAEGRHHQLLESSQLYAQLVKKEMQ
ncbi:antigen peptide transporter 1 [Hippocampus comes]|uniref:Transporter 1, ATP-binding cassette, sub-family B (MDR/TAP) n=1 Tax=Hippocampus comes TaxID=109280 RepID=A0A3Q2XXD0_HIPCM|nr:PREDICTED: antigen peptide transporter 1 [Hippocampus comes]